MNKDWTQEQWEAELVLSKNCLTTTISWVPFITYFLAFEAFLILFNIELQIPQIGLEIFHIFRPDPPLKKKRNSSLLLT